MLKIITTNKGHKMVIQDCFSGYTVTSEENYNSYVSDARKIHTLNKSDGFNNLAEVEEYIKNYF